MSVEIIDVVVLAMFGFAAVQFMRSDAELDEWWSFLPFKTSCITGYRYALDNNMIHRNWFTETEDRP